MWTWADPIRLLAFGSGLTRSAAIVPWCLSFARVASARLRASRRLRARSGEHAGGVRSWPCGGRRRPGTGRPSVRRRGGRRVPRRDARPHDECLGPGRSSHGGRARAGGCRVSLADAAGRASLSGVRGRRSDAARGASPLPGRAHHHRDEGRSSRDGTGGGRRSPGRRRRRPRLRRRLRISRCRAARAALPAMATSATRWEVRLALYRSWARWPVRDT